MSTQPRTLATIADPLAEGRRTKKLRAWIGWGALALLALTLLVLLVWEGIAAEASPPPPERDYRAEIIRDQFGVPHIYGKTDADVAYGLARAHAEDDFFTLQDVVAMTRGRYGAIAGTEGAQLDFALALLDARGTAQRDYPQLPADTRAVLEAYASGLNDHAAAHPGELKLANLFPVNGEDIAAGFALRQPLFFGLFNTVGPLVADEPLNREFGPRIILDAESAPPAPLPQGEDAANVGSNAFAIAPQKSGDGVTRLVSNSHQPWRGGVAWYEAVVESEEGLHFAGATFPGSPFIFLGHNEKLGWTNTVNRPDMTDVYKLVVNEDETEYRLDGKWLPLEREDVTLAAKIGPLTVPATRSIYRSVHGPVIRQDDGDFYAIRYGGMYSIAMLDAYYRLPKAQSFEEWRGILATHAIPSTNFIYADETGNIAYIYNASIPDRPEGYDWRGILPGDESAAIWNGLVDYDALPQYKNPGSGYLYNANNQPFFAAGSSDLSPDSVAPEMGVELTMTNRAFRADKLMREADTIDRETLERIKYDTGYERKDYVADLFDAIAGLDVSDDPQLLEAQSLLAGWDFKADGIGTGDALALLMIREAMGNRYNNEAAPDTREQLEAAVDHLMTHFGHLDVPQGELLRLRQGDTDLPLDGGSDTLRASTLWDVEDDGRLAVRHGDSFLMFVEWAPGKPVSSESIQPYGQAITRPDSMHFADQAALFVMHRLKPVHFWRSDARANSRVRYTVSSR
ncbi:penicillin acylase family protein [Alteriqipengyuania sp. WL0013]|uniref:penicillin acylase family protein n=1 Tax=Alteriqipengyuania sp. WL0013 TaxID=3110773 RepID=UPI002C8FF59A|nr:penicillin acylase family protein [Alteriqipengyuania sp. WL0013]MEB3415868.1 penicillin acylase family protein [Alteriqipengyuania sp. WL0013]